MDIHKNGTLDFESEIKYKEIRQGKWVRQGQLKDGSTRHGICRYIRDDRISEGQFNEDKINGYARIINKDSYFIGQFKDNLRYGQGKCEYSDGRIEEGKWEDL